MRIICKKDRFTKTGSGQTKSTTGKLTTKERYYRFGRAGGKFCLCIGQALQPGVGAPLS
eukprot:COSAG06_NODE_5959_length_3183_cov_6.510376_2_plen_59_part_00